MLRIVSPVSRITSTGLLGKVTASTHTPHTSFVVVLSLAFKVQCGCADYGLFSGRRTFASTSARGADITLTVDGKEVTVPQGFFFWVSFELAMVMKTDLK